MLNWRLNVSTNCVTFSGIALTVGRTSNIQFNQTNFLYTIVAWAAIAQPWRHRGEFAETHPTQAYSQPRIHWLTLQRQHPEHTLVHPPQRFTANKPLQPFDTQRKLTQRQ